MSFIICKKAEALRNVHYSRHDRKWHVVMRPADALYCDTCAPKVAADYNARLP